MKRIIKNSWRNIRRAPYQALAAISVFTLSVFVAQVIVIVSLGMAQVLYYFETRPEVTAFFTDEVSETAILTIKQQLEKQDYVAGVKYVSKNDAFNFYKEQNKNDPLLLEMVTPDILPPSLEVAAKSAVDLPKIKAELEKTTGIDEVVYHEDVIESLNRWTKGIRVSGIVLVSILSLLAVLVMTIVISMKVSSRKEEITTVRLLGASDFFIQGPYIFEGAFYGLFASLLAMIATTSVLLYSANMLQTFLEGIPVMSSPLSTLSLVYGSSTLAAIILGMLVGKMTASRFGR